MQRETLSKWWSLNDDLTHNHSMTVWVVSDIYTEFYNSEVGRDLLFFLKKCKVNVKLITLNTSIVALISKGLLDEAKQSLNVFYKKLSNIPKQDLIVGIEPSETLVWRDESKFLINKKMNVSLIEELILKLNKLGLLPALKKIDKKILIHLHCHQKSLVGDQVTLDSLLLIPGLKASVMNGGCCGMAGDFGYKHPEVSEKIAHNSLQESTKKVQRDDVLIATGASCRKQILDVFHIDSAHPSHLFISSARFNDAKR